MSCRLVLFAILLLGVAPVALAGEVDGLTVARAIRQDLTRPFLYFNQAEKAQLIERIANDPEAAAIFKRVRESADQRLAQTLEPAPPREADTLHGGPHLSYYVSTLAGAFELAFVYQLTGEERYASKAWELAEAVCNLPAWNYRFHEFDTIYGRIWPWNVGDDQVAFGYDIMSARAGRDMAAVYDWLYETLDQPQRDKIRGALLEKVIAPVRGNLDLHWWATAYRCNWVSVCLSGTGMAALALLPEHPTLAGLVADSHNGIRRMYDQLDAGGGWQEGVSYFHYGFLHAAQFSDILRRLSDDRINLFEHPHLKERAVDCIIYNFIPPNRSVNFGDSSSMTVGASAFINLMAAGTGNGRAAWYRREVVPDGSEIYDLLWPRPTAVEPRAPEQASHLFPDIEWAVLRSDFSNPDQFTIASKAGDNDDPHHGHLDCGHFLLFYNGIAFVSETARTPYDDRYFLEDRWTYPSANSLGHNLIFVNGEQQLSAKHKDQPWRRLNGRIVEFRPGAGRDYVLLDPTGVYAGEHLRSWRRHVVLDKPTVALIVDEVRCAPGAEIAVRFHSEAEAEVMDDLVLLESRKGTVALIPLPDEPYTVEAQTHQLISRRDGTEPIIQPYYDLKLTARQDRTLIGSLFVPVADLAEARAVQSSIRRPQSADGQLTFELEYRGQSLGFQFEPTPEGLVLMD